MRSSITRRALLAGAIPTLGARAETLPFSDYSAEFRVDAQAAEPRVKCYDLRRLASVITPQDEFFSFHQGRTARAGAAEWRVGVGGFVQRARVFTLDQLRSRPDVLVTPAVIECSGNSGQPALMNGLVSTAEWTGVPLAAVLRECGVLEEAREVVFLGSDVTKERKWSAGDKEFTSPHGRSLSIQDALGAGALLAFGMNGTPLPAEHGFPLRLVVPGWYGMAHIKWLTRIEVLDRRYEGQHMSRNYHSLHRLQNDRWLDTSITRNRLKSVVARVSHVGGRFTISGAAWGGGAPIRTVEVRVDAGEWRAANLEGGGGAHSWRLWSMEWPKPARGLHTLVSRAIDMQGRIQPTREELRQRMASNREDHSQWTCRIEIPA